MIVDDHAGTRKMIRKLLDFLGTTFCECATGDEAVSRAREFKPDWVTMDVHMPGSNGFQSTEALRKEYPPARVILVTAHNEPHFLRLSHVAGAVALVCKENLFVVRMILTNEMTSSNPLPSTSDSPSPTVS